MGQPLPRGWTAVALLLAGAAGALTSRPAAAAPGNDEPDGTVLVQVRATLGTAGAPQQHNTSSSGGGSRPLDPRTGRPHRAPDEGGRAPGARSSRASSSGRRPLHPASSPSVHLLVSLYLPQEGRQEHPHVQEMLAAFHANLENAVIASVHVLLEAPGRSCSALPAAVQRATGRRVAPSDFDRVKCRAWAQQPTYSDFFRYANSSMSRTGNIVLANADIVFDGTLRRMRQLQPGREGHLISVRAPHYSGEFRSLWRTPCTTVLNKCTRETKSWDAYAFSLPLPPQLLLGSDLEFTMNILTADHRAAFALDHSGMKLTNPCMHVNAFHWHCFSPKMHSSFRDESMDGSYGNASKSTERRRYRNESKKPGLIIKSYPCDDFPGDEYAVPACRH